MRRGLQRFASAYPKAAAFLFGTATPQTAPWRIRRRLRRFASAYPKSRAFFFAAVAVTVLYVILEVLGWAP